MKKLALYILAFVFTLFSGSARAQDTTGTWQGTLTVQGKDLRLVLKVSKADTGKLKGVLYSIDQPAPPIPLSIMSIEAGAMKFGVTGFATYEGKLSPDGMTSTGTWTQGPLSLPLVMKHVTDAVAWPIPEAPVQLKPMPADADPTFDVATIKPSSPDQPAKMLTIQGRQLVTRNFTLAELISFAYDVHIKQVTGGADWMNTQKYDITAVPDIPGTPSVKQLKSMLKKLLIERYKLAFHHDKKELAVYALSVAKGGSKLTRSTDDPNGLPGLGFPGGPGKFAAHNASMVDFVGLFQTLVLDRPVVDQTGLTGRFDFALNWTPDDSQFHGAKLPPPSETADAPPSLFTAIQEQIGLKLEAVKAPVDVMVIDHVEKPSEN